MPFSTEQLAYGAKAAIDYFLKNDPVDNINTVRPLIEMLIAGKKEYGGGLQNVVEQLRFSNDSNFQSYFGDGQVSYNRKRTLNQAKYTWGSFHDGFGLDEDELTQNGIVMTDDKSTTPTDAEKVQLTNLLEENMETLKLGFQENFDIMLHRDGTQSATDIPGLPALISLTPSAGVVGGIDPSLAANSWWRNYVDTAIPDGNAANAAMQLALEKAWRACIRVGGQAPDFILCGSNFIDQYRVASALAPNGGIQRQVIVGGSGGNKTGTTLDVGVGTGVSTGLYFKGVELVWDPVFDTMDTLDAPTIKWRNRAYFIRKDKLKLRPIKGHWLISRRPPRVYDRYVHYFGLTAKAALTTGKRNAHAVLALASNA
jgi:hypothetical protein